ncbi:MAG: redoxin family protein [Flavobacteriaceae bacterium]|nr:redoxin family protein [Flavobacteriaceae bacterium]
MKKRIALIFVLAVLVTICFFFKKETSSLDYSTVSKKVEITNIKRTSQSTTIDFKVNHSFAFVFEGFRSPNAKVYIQNSNGGKKLYLQEAVGIRLDSVYKDTSYQKIKYSLVFPKFHDSIKSFDYYGVHTRVFDIGLSNTKEPKRFSDKIRGNWFSTDGSNKWILGLYEDVIIYKNKLWATFKLTKKTNNQIIQLTEGDSTKVLVIKENGNNVLVGENLKELKLLSKAKTQTKEFKENIPKKAFEFKEGIAKYQGFIKGYHPKFNWNVNVLVRNPIINLNKTYSTKVNDNGTFEVYVPLEYAQRVYVRFESNERIGKIDVLPFLEPEKTLTQIIDAKKVQYQNNVSEFMGNKQRLNSELANLDTLNVNVNRVLHPKFYKDFLSITREEYKNYITANYKKKIKTLKDIGEKRLVSKEAIEFKKKLLGLQLMSNVLAYDLERRTVIHLNKDKTTVESGKENKLVVENKPVDKSYYNFLQTENLNTVSMLSLGSEYATVINYLRFDSQILPLGFYNYFDEFKKTLQKEKIKLSKKEDLFLDKLSLCRDVNCVKKLKKENKNLWRNFSEHYGSLMNISQLNNFYKIRRKKRIELQGVTSKLVNDIIASQHRADIINRENKLLSNIELEELEKEISNKQFKKILKKQHNIKKLELLSLKENRDYFLHDVTNVNETEVFRHILNLFKDNVIFIDFWATWCGPCVNDFENVKPLKTKLQGEKIKFVYITGETSPIDNYHAIVKGVKGNHFRLTKSQWEYLMNSFLIKGIPRYMFIDKKGEIVTENLRAPFLTGELETLLKKHL